MEKDYLTTTEAAKLLAVSSDCVLRWVRNGKIKSYRTPGGHARIPRDSINILMNGQNSTEWDFPKEEKVHEYCWEFLTQGGEVKDECTECITYKSRAIRCYELRDLPGNPGCLRLDCDLTCQECEYYKLVNGKVHNVLILTESRILLKDSFRLDTVHDLKVKMVANEYDCSYVIEKFRPDYIVVDASFGKKRTSLFCNNLFNDPRIPVTRIVLASESREHQEYCDKEVFGWIKRPFTIQQLRDCISGTSH
ncbi:helix-turn-helix domain-containing protein [candidate division KSB1 bacterium]